MADFVFHLPAPVLRGKAPLKPFYEKLTEGLIARGHALRMVPHDRDRAAATVAGDPDAIHILDHGTLRHPRVLNAGVAYVFPFWNLDPWGIRALSSIAAERFDPAAVDMAAARPWVARHRRRLVEGRVSRYPQPQGRVELPPDAIAVFLQSDAHRTVGETAHLSSDAMIAALLARDDPAPILIKPHPLDTDPATAARLAAIDDPRVRIVQANIHDIIAAATVVVTINSACGIEAMFHGRPVVLCGESDFHHAAVTVRRAEEMDQAIATARATDWPFDAFLYWYFACRCLNAGSGTLVEDFLGRVAALSPPSPQAGR